MRAKYFYVLAVIILLTSCQKEELKKELEVQETLDYEEFFIANVDGKNIEVLDPERMGAVRSVGYKSGIPALGIFGYEESWGEISIYFCFYDGAGKYTTGNQKDAGYSLYWDKQDNIWEDLPQMENPSQIEITYADEEIVEGKFYVTGYNVDDITKKITFSGSFGLLLEEEGTGN